MDEFDRKARYQAEREKVEEFRKYLKDPANKKDWSQEPNWVLEALRGYLGEGRVEAIIKSRQLNLN